MKQLGIFAKYWEPGRVKTRLAQRIGNEQASRLHRVFLRTLLRRTGSLADHRRLAFWPPERQASFGELGGTAWTLEPQTGNDLGERMRHYFAAAFARGAREVVLLGSDSPTLPLSTIASALEQLESHEVVLGPAEDGGYYLVGAAGRLPPIFEQVAWSTPAVWDQTRRHLEQAGVRWYELPRWYDVDEWADLQRLRDELRGASGGDDWLPELRDAVETALSKQMRHA